MSSSMIEGSSQASTSWTICVRLSPSQRLCSKRTGRSIAEQPTAGRGTGTASADADATPVSVMTGLTGGHRPNEGARGRDHSPNAAPAATGLVSPGGPAGRSNGQPPPGSHYNNRSSVDHLPSLVAPVNHGER